MAKPVYLWALAFFFLNGTVAAKSFTLSAEDDYYPYSAKIDGQLVGLVPEIAVAAFEAVGVEVEFRIHPYARILVQVEHGQVVGGFTGAIDESNESRFYWHSTPIDTVRLAIWARADSDESHLTASELEGHHVSVTRGFFYTDAVDTNEKITKAVAPSDASSLKMLALGRSDYALVTEKIGRAIVESSDDPVLENKIKIVGLIDEVALYAFFSKAHPKGKEAAELFQEGLEAIIQNGRYNRIMDRWRH